MKLLPAAALALLASVPMLASAQVLVNFENVWPFGTDVNGYYGGGTASDGTSGANLGVSFVNVSGLSNEPAFTYYSGAPTPLGVGYAHTFDVADRAFLNVAAGTANTLSFFYSSPEAVTGAIRAFSGMNGTGTLLGSFNLLANATSDYDKWTAATFAFSGVARSFDLTGTANLVALDNISVSAVPEPSTVALMLLGGAALAQRIRRRRA
jgi:hypothetical protein